MPEEPGHGGRTHVKESPKNPGRFNSRLPIDGGVSFGSSFGEDDGTNVNGQTAEDFVLPNDAVVTGVRWWYALNDRISVRASQRV
jgi:hypothetical protein